MINTNQVTTPAPGSFNGGASIELQMLKDEVSSLQRSVEDKYVKSDTPSPEIKGKDVIDKCKKTESKGLFSGLKTAGAAIGGLLTGYAIGEISKNIDLTDKEADKKADNVGNSPNFQGECGSLSPAAMNAADNKGYSIKKDTPGGESKETAKPQVKSDPSDISMQDVMELIKKERSPFRNFSDFSSSFKDEALLSTNEIMKQDYINDTETKLKDTLKSVKSWDNYRDLDKYPEKGRVSYTVDEYTHDLTYGAGGVKYIQKCKYSSNTGMKIYYDNEKRTLYKDIYTIGSDHTPYYNKGYFVDKTTNTYYIWNGNNED